MRVIVMSEIKKHYKQMNFAEVFMSQFIIQSVDKRMWKFSYHAIDKIDALNIDMNKKDIVEMIYESDIIEYKIKKYFNRAREGLAIRNRYNYKGYNICMYICITTKTIVTVWLNRKNDHHRTLNLNRYSDNLKIV